jgi:protein-tyrosine phosphatase
MHLWFPASLGLALAGLACATGARAGRPRRLAFVCTGNTGRSVMAAALARAFLGEHQGRLQVISRALDPDPRETGPEAHVVTLLAARGIDVSSHRPVPFSAGDARAADLILTMTGTQKSRLIDRFPETGGRTFTLAEYATGTHAEVADAWGQPLPACAELLRQLDALVPAALERFARRSRDHRE